MAIKSKNMVPDPDVGNSRAEKVRKVESTFLERNEVTRGGVKNERWSPRPFEGLRWKPHQTGR